MQDYEEIYDPRSTDIGAVGQAIKVKSASNLSEDTGETREEYEARIGPMLKEAWVAPLPEEAQCSACHRFDGTHPEVREVMAQKIERGKGNASVVLGGYCNCDQTREAEIDRRWQQSGLTQHLDKTRTFANFLIGGQPILQKVHDKALRLTQNPSSPILLLVGGVGVGKSHILEGACREALNLGRSARYELSSSIMDNLRSSYSANTSETMTYWMQWYRSKWLLAIDDLGLESGTDFVQERLTMILEERIHNRLRTIVSTNLTKDDVEYRYGARLASRLFSFNPENDDSEVVVISGVPDYRS